MNNSLAFSEKRLVGNLLQILRKPNFTSTFEFLEKHIYLSSAQTADPGYLRLYKTPWMYLFVDYLDDPKIKFIYGRKSSRIAWTTIINGWIAKVGLQDKLNVAICFAKADSRTVYFKRFLKPMILSTPALLDVIKKKVHINKINPKFIELDNCDLSLLNLGTSSDTKSIFVTRLVFEEPDEVKPDVNNQGNAIDLVQDRKKTAEDFKVIIGGTPTDSSFSQIAQLFNQSNQLHFWAKCHYEDCQQFHAITKREAWDNFQYNHWPDGRNDEIYGPYDPESILYLCPHCKKPWSFEQKNKNIAESTKYNLKGWIPEKPEITDTAGFQFNELLSNFPGCKFTEIGKEYLKAKKRYDEGFEDGMRKFVNTKMGFEYAPIHKGIDVEGLIAKRKTNYKEGQVPEGYPILFCTIDKQRGSKYEHGATSRFECIVRAHGRNNNSTLVKYEILEGNTHDRTDPVWDRLTDFINTTWEIQGFPGKRLPIQAVAIDCADDSRLVYDWVNDVTSNIDEFGFEKTPKFCSPLFGNAVFAVRGSSQRYDKNLPIYNDPKTFMEISNGAQERRSVAETMGITPYIMGTTASHDEYTRRLNLEGPRDRIYHVETSYPGYERSALSCVKNVDGQWKQIPGWPKEIRDCERMQLWLADRPMYIPDGDGFITVSQMSNSMWNAIEYKISQGWR